MKKRLSLATALCVAAVLAVGNSPARADVSGKEYDGTVLCVGAAVGGLFQSEAAVEFNSDGTVEVHVAGVGTFVGTWTQQDFGVVSLVQLSVSFGGIGVLSNGIQVLNFGFGWGFGGGVFCFFSGVED